MFSFLFGLICVTLIHVLPPPFLCSSNSTHCILPHGSYVLVSVAVDQNCLHSVPSRPNIAARTSQSTNFHLTQGQSTLKFPLMGMVYSTRELLHILMTGLKKCLYSWQCKIRKFTVTAFHCEESTHIKAANGQNSRELTTLPKPPNSLNMSTYSYNSC